MSIHFYILIYLYNVYYLKALKKNIEQDVLVHNFIYRTKEWNRYIIGLERLILT